MTTDLAIERGELVAQNRRPRHLEALPAELARVRAAERRGVGGRDRSVWLATPVALTAGLPPSVVAQARRSAAELASRFDRLPAPPARVVGRDPERLPTWPAWGTTALSDRVGVVELILEPMHIDADTEDRM
jgi:hypothetical protein